jgi:hypothetical protein
MMEVHRGFKNIGRAIYASKSRVEIHGADQEDQGHSRPHGVRNRSGVTAVN